MLSMEHLRCNPILKRVYAEFINVYADLSHMEAIRNKDLNSEYLYYLPHHAIIKQSEPEEKIRMMFNAFFRIISVIIE